MNLAIMIWVSVEVFLYVSHQLWGRFICLSIYFLQLPMTCLSLISARGVSGSAIHIKHTLRGVMGESAGGAKGRREMALQEHLSFSGLNLGGLSTETTSFSLNHKDQD